MKKSHCFRLPLIRPTGLSGKNDEKKRKSTLNADYLKEIRNIILLTHR